MEQWKRFEILQKIAQGVPTSSVSQTQNVAGAPPPFSTYNLYPGIVVAFQPKNALIIDRLANILNNSLYYLSNGEFSLQWMKNNNFVFGTSDIPAMPLRLIMNFTKLVYNTLFSEHGTFYKIPLTPEEIKEKINILKNSQFLLNLPSTNLSGQLASKIGGNLREIVNNLLLQIR